MEMKSSVTALRLVLNSSSIMDDDCRDLLQQLLTPHRDERAAAADIADNADGEPETGWDDLIASYVVPRGTEEADSACAELTAAGSGQNLFTWTESSFGSVQDLVQIGNELQKSCFAAFRWVVQGVDSITARARQKYQVDWTRRAQLYREAVCNKVLRSRAALAEHTGMAPSTLGDWLLQLGACLLYVAAWLIGAFLSVLARLLEPRRQGRFKPIAVVNAWRYDETPLRLKLQEWQVFTNSTIPPAKVRRRSSVIRGILQTETYCHAKIFATEWQYGCPAAFRVRCSRLAVKRDGLFP